jgi:hypothetical protein
MTATTGITVKIVMNDKANPSGKLADAELHVTDGPLEGLKERGRQSGAPMRHLSTYLNPRAAGLTPHRVQFTLKESAPVRSILDEGGIYRHPERLEEAIVWSQDEASIAEVLNYHYGRGWSSLTILPPALSGR